MAVGPVELARRLAAGFGLGFGPHLLLRKDVPQVFDEGKTEIDT